VSSATIPKSSTPPIFVQTARAPFSFFATTLGRKVIMAITGAALFGFVILHMIGNLQVFLGAHAMNEYAAWLRELAHGAALWGMRLGLLVAAALHVGSAYSLSCDSLAARPLGYRRRRWRDSDYASRTMRWSGVLLALFIVYHLMHFTFGNAHHDFREGDAYYNLVSAFQIWPISLAYIVAMGALGLHLYHGAWSFTQTLGWAHPRYDGIRRAATVGLALAVTAGFLTVPIAVLLGVVR
jgi:succinate dehydrogenase / fumarate reductase cytochrome b subunit